MGNLSADTEQTCDEIAPRCDAIKAILEPRQTDLGGFFVRRLLPTIGHRKVGPWVFFDHMGPAHFPAGKGINVRPHPHIGLATVTYLFEGEILHRDSLGTEQPIRPGDINLMVAGSGIVHSERERPEVTATDHAMDGLQLWLALPVDEEEREPSFHHYASEDVPALEVDGVPVRVMMGSAYGVTSPVQTFGRTLYVEANLRKGQTLVLPDAEERALYVARGSVSARDAMIRENAMAILTSQSGVTVKAEADTRLAVIGGEPFNPRYIEWNFVSSRKERIEEAKSDWRQERFPTIPGDDQESIPLPR